MRKTKTYGFAMPLLNISKSTLNKRVINAYIHDEEFEDDSSYRLFLVHSNYQDIEFKEWEESLLNHKDLVASYDINDTSYGVKVFDIPQYFHKDFDLFMQGKYSEMSLEAQKLVEKFHLDPFYKQVFTKDRKRKEYVESIIGESIGKQEVYSIPNIQDETLDKEKKKKYKYISRVKP